MYQNIKKNRLILIKRLSEKIIVLISWNNYFTILITLNTTSITLRSL